jgi:hypothetical protein
VKCRVRWSESRWAPGAALAHVGDPDFGRGERRHRSSLTENHQAGEVGMGIADDRWHGQSAAYPDALASLMEVHIHDSEGCYLSITQLLVA